MKGGITSLSTLYLQVSCLNDRSRKIIRNMLIITDDGVSVALLTDHDNSVPGIGLSDHVGSEDPVVFSVNQEDYDDEDDGEERGTENGGLKIMINIDGLLCPRPAICLVFLFQ